MCWSSWNVLEQLRYDAEGHGVRGVPSKHLIAKGMFCLQPRLERKNIPDLEGRGQEVGKSTSVEGASVV